MKKSSNIMSQINGLTDLDELKAIWATTAARYKLVAKAKAAKSLLKFQVGDIVAFPTKKWSKPIQIKITKLGRTKVKGTQLQGPPQWNGQTWTVGANACTKVKKG